MKYRIIAVVVLGLLILNLGGSSFADTKAKRAGFSDLVSLLPASDGVATFDVKRFFGNALPQLLSGNQPMLAKITEKIDELQTKIGIDVRQFDDVVVGVSARQIAAKKYDVDPVVIARGRMTSASLIGASKLVSNGKYREERVGERVMYIIDVSKIAAQKQAGVKAMSDMSEVAVAAIGDRMIAFGDPGRVRQTLEAKTKVGADLVGMLQKNPSAIAAFAAKPPEGLKAFVPLDNDELGRNIDSIEYLYGHADVASETAAVHVTARTRQNAQATSLYETLEGLQVIGKAFLGGSKSANQRVYARLIERAKFAVKANEVTFDLSLPQSDIDVLVGGLK